MPFTKSQVWMNINEYLRVQNALFFCKTVTQHGLNTPCHPFTSVTPFHSTHRVNLKDYMLFIATFITYSKKGNLQQCCCTRIQKNALTNAPSGQNENLASQY